MFVSGFDSLFCFDVLGNIKAKNAFKFSIALPSHEVEELNVLMQLSIGLYFTSFISIAILRLGLNGSVHSGVNFLKSKRCRNLGGGRVKFGSRLQWI